MHVNGIQMTDGSEYDIQIWWTRGWKCRTRAQPECDIFNLRSIIFDRRMTSYELLRWLVEMQSRDVDHYYISYTFE